MLSADVGTIYYPAQPGGACRLRGSGGGSAVRHLRETSIPEPASNLTPSAALPGLTPSVRLAALDGIRALSILAVIGVHLSVPFAPGGGMGVIVFFVLSGFLITTLLLDERERLGQVSLRLFYARRALRLGPALAVVLVAACVVALSSPGTALSKETLHFAPAALLYVGNWLRALSPKFVGGTLAHTWSLSVEEQFYLLWPPTLMLMLACGARLRTVLWAALAGALLSDLGKIVDWSSGASLDAAANRMYGTDLSADALLLGCALAVAIRIDPARMRRLVRFLGPPAAVYLVVVVTVIHPLVGGYQAARAFDAIAWPMVSVAAAAVIGHLVLVRGSIAARALSLPPVTYIGRISYGLYLWHYPLLIWMVLWAHFALHSVAWQALVDVALSVAVASLSYHVIERRALALKDRLRPATAAATAAGEAVLAYSRHADL
jgi:peptidoglycan/LPS O-acetylase OafA/YrhL